MQGADVPAAAFAEVKVGAFDEVRRVVLGDEVANELVGGEGEELGRGDEAYDAVGAGVAQPPFALIECGEARRLGAGAKDAGRVRIEGERDDVAAVADERSGSGDEGLMAAVHAVKVADGQRSHA